MTDAIKLVFSWLWAYLKPVTKILAKKASKEALELAIKYVTEAQTNPALKTGEAKRAWVAEQLKQADLSTGEPLTDKVINFLIELAVLNLKS